LIKVISGKLAAELCDWQMVGCSCTGCADLVTKDGGLNAGPHSSENGFKGALCRQALHVLPQALHCKLHIV